MSNDEHRLHRQIKAAAALKQSLKDMLGEDDEAMRDMIEGETNLHEMIEHVVLSIEDDNVLVVGLSARLEELQSRKTRFENRIASKRAMIEQAMVIGELESLERPTFTLSLRSTPVKAEIIDESLIPSAYWKPQPPKLDKRALLAALKEGGDVAGASLSNGGISLQIRTK